MSKLLAITALLITLPLHAAEPLRLGTQERPPYAIVRPDGSFDGIAVRVVECALRKMEQPYTMQAMPWARVLALAERGEIDGFFPGTYLSERARWTTESAPIAAQRWVWYLRAGSTLDPLSAEFRQRATVGAHFGSIRLKMLEQENYKVVLSPQTDRALLQAFAAGRADAILGSDLALEEAVRELKLDPKAFRIVPLRNTPQHAFFNKQFLARHPGFMDQFNAHVPECRKAVK
jgi:polar amino acid transport system substrate-binding protein